MREQRTIRSFRRHFKDCMESNSVARDEDTAGTAFVKLAWDLIEESVFK